VNYQGNNYRPIQDSHLKKYSHTPGSYTWTRILLLAVFLLSLLGSDRLAAQSFLPSTIEIAISAEVQSTSIQLITMQGMDFTDVQQDQRQLRVDPVSSQRAGKMVAIGDPDSSFRISFLRNREFTNIDGAGTIQIEYLVSGFEQDEQDNSDLIEMESRELIFSNEGEFYFWVGGNVNLEQATPGTYEGEFTLEIEYL